MKQKLIKGPVKGYKGTDKNMKCNGFQFQMGDNVLGNNDDLVLCKKGFHFCQQPSGPFSYGNYDRLFKVEAYDVLDSEWAPGADYKQVCRKIRFLEEIKINGDYNTGYRNSGNRNTGDGNTGEYNSGYYNTGDYNTGYRNTGRYNTGNRNSGDGNTGDYNTGDYNTGDGNATNSCSGYFCCQKQPFIFFDKPTNCKVDEINRSLVAGLARKLQQDEEFDYVAFVDLPNATIEKIKALHAEHIRLRKAVNK